METNPPVERELLAMQQCYDLLAKFPQPTVNRMLNWLHKRLVDQSEVLTWLQQHIKQDLDGPVTKAIGRPHLYSVSSRERVG
jgi:hypothetical protein